MNFTSELQKKQNSNLPVINEEEEDCQIQHSRRTYFETSFEKLQTQPNELKSNTKSTGLDKFMKFLHQKETNSSNKIKPHSLDKNMPQLDQLNPENCTRSRPKSSNQMKAMNKFTQFLQVQQQAMLEKLKRKKQNKVGGLNKFMQTLNTAETIIQQKKLSNIVSGILAVSESLPQNLKGTSKYRYLINEQKFKEIVSESKHMKRRSRSACSLSKVSKQLKSKNCPQTQLLQKIGAKKDLLTKLQTTNSGFERKVKFFQNINDGKPLKIKLSQSAKKGFEFLS